MGDTEQILKAMSDMEIRLNDRLANMDSNLGARLDDHDRRITDLEGENKGVRDSLKFLEEQRVRDRKLIQDLMDRIIASEAHQRRLSLTFHGITYQENEDTLMLLKDFLCRVLRMSQQEVNSIWFRDVHRLGESRRGKGRAIIAAFTSQFQRNEVFKLAYRLKNTPYVMKVDLPKELASVQDQLLMIRKEIRRVNPTALAALTYRSYKPVLLVKHANKVQPYDATKMQFGDLMEGDPRPEPMDPSSSQRG